MVDMKPVNNKLIKRAENLIREITGCSEDRSIKLLKESENNTKLAITMELTKLDSIAAKKMLEDNDGSIRKVMEKLK